ncbi:damage-control phosphatase ARMT1-like isoform X2 [Coccinella septempunctata]|uniref:damage-control phosphatase ARMT1-like isoform X2 n=1 Tax=Coccinella septempunctata TaxID=41139 RepID=UPI001D066A9D|nr:damage-control phosphatase ARMT1-like isoform X2 [Coccinella septempunctata]
MALKASRPCFCAYNRTMDLRTPRNVKLTAFFRRSFAFRTVRDRLPVILTKTIDSLSQKKDDIAKEYGSEARDEIKTVVGKLSRLKYEIQTNKPLKNIRSQAPDAAIYNEYIRERDGMEGVPTPFHTVWLLVECYMYRKIWEAFEKTKYLKDFDPFRFNKEELFRSGVPQIKETLAQLQNFAKNPLANKEDFCTLLQINLWSNKCDLSLSPDGVNPILGDQLSELSKNVLVNDSEKIWNALQSSEGEAIDIILDNAGAELLSDLCVAHYLTEKNLVKKVNFHVKSLPWFMSDVMLKDIKWMLKEMSENECELLKSFGEIWSKNFENNTWSIKSSDFWTLPVEFEMMHKYDRELYKHLALSKLIIFKGDLNYRKLFREMFWCAETPVADAQGQFAPARLCAIRTCKAEIICGLPNNLADELDVKDPLWMESGNYGVIQFSDKIVPLMDEEDLDNLKDMFHYWTPTKKDIAVAITCDA